MYLQSLLYVHFLQNKKVWVLIWALIFSLEIHASRIVNIYNLENQEFTYTIEKDLYKVHSPKQKYIDYNKYDGFAFFLPYFTKEYELQILRFNSIGSISGILSTYQNKNDAKIIHKKERIDLRYYFTDYKLQSETQLDLLLQNQAIYYDTEAALSFEGLNVPLSKSKELQKWFYFHFDKTQNNPLQHLVSSFSLTFDKKTIDEYVKKNIKNIYTHSNPDYTSIHTFMINLTMLKKNIETGTQEKNTPSLKSPLTPENKPENKNVKPKAYLRMNPYLDMEYFTYEQDYESKYQVNSLDYKLNTIKYKLKSFQDELNNINEMDGRIDAFQNYERFNKKLVELKKSFEYMKIDVILEEIKKLDEDSKCNDYKILNKECLDDAKYFHNYVYHLIANGDEVDETLISSVKDEKVLNNLGAYHFKQKNMKKSEEYLLNGYALSNKNIKKILAYNLGVFYMKTNTLENLKKAVLFFEEANLPKARHNLGLLYYFGLGVNEDDIKAREYFKKASEEGVKDSTLNYEKLK